MRTLLFIAIGLLIFGLILAENALAPPDVPEHELDTSTEAVERGRYLAGAGGCVSRAIS